MARAEESEQEPPVKEIVDVTGEGVEEVVSTVGSTALLALSYTGVAVLVRSPSGAITLLHPRVFDAIPVEALTEELLQCWEEEEVEAYLTERFNRTGVSNDE